MSLVKVGELTCEPGEKIFSWLRTADMPDGDLPWGNFAWMPLIIVNGIEKGPRIGVFGAIHAEEVEGTQAIVRLVSELDPKAMKGTLIAVPVTNLSAYHEGRRHNPVDNLNLNRVFPGKEYGSVTERMAYVIYRDIVPQVDYIIDLHSKGMNVDGTPEMCCKKYADKELRKKSLELAEAFGVTVLLEHSIEESADYGTLDSESEKRGIPYIFSEMPGPGTGHRDLEKNIAIATKGLKNIMKYLGMIPGKPEMPEKTVYVLRQFPIPAVSPLTTKIGGFVVCHVKIGEEVKVGQKVATILDIWGNEVETLCSPYKGIARKIYNYPVVKPGSKPIDVIKLISKEEIGELW